MGGGEWEGYEDGLRGYLSASRVGQTTSLQTPSRSRVGREGGGKGGRGGNRTGSLGDASLPALGVSGPPLL